MEYNKILLGDCLDSLKLLEDNSVDAIVTDPPYGLSFMGKKWDYDVPSVEIWAECSRVLKPGGYLLSFAGTRTQHRMAVRIEDAGFEIRDMIAWVYGSGFPKSLNIGKAVDKLQGNEREKIGEISSQDITSGGLVGKEYSRHQVDVTKGTSEWEGWGTALKPALEPITVARKPISEKTVAENCLKWGVGGINIDECRVKKEEGDRTEYGVNGITRTTGNVFGKQYGEIEFDGTQGRFPANFIHDGSDEVKGLFPESKSGSKKANQENYNHEGKEFVATLGASVNEYKASSGSASRFFYCAKASKSERNKGCEELTKEVKGMNFGGELAGNGEPINIGTNKNFHPTVKPIALMEYLVKMVSKEGHTVLDPFAGSGSTLIACKKLNRNYIGMEMDIEYIKIAEARLDF